MTRDRTRLGTYRDKREPGVTNEPFGGEAGTRASSPGDLGAFVVHLHHATRTHYDVRLEVSGVLWSFAVPRGPSLDPTERMLAVKTEDHPIEYLDFEDVIPAGEYGGGPMIVWDRGSVRYLEGPPEVELLAGKVHIELRGLKLRGHFGFIQLARSKAGNEWLFFKKTDAHADASRSVVDELPRSVLSGLLATDLAQRDAIGRALVQEAVAIAGRTRVDVATLDAAALVQVGERAATAVTYDAELEGVRVLAVRDGDVVVLRTPGGNIEAFYPDVVRALRSLPVTRFALDGTLVTFAPEGRPSLSLLAQRVARIVKGDLHAAVTLTPVTFVAEDVLALGEADVRKTTIERRRQLLAKLLPASTAVVRAAMPLEGDEARVLEACAGHGIATLVAKSKGSPYAAGAWSLRGTGAPPRSRASIDHHGLDARSPRSPVVTNRGKVYWPADGRTKGDLLDYYAAIADVILPCLKDRPVILVRYPDGIEGKSFFQWNVPAGMPAWVRTLVLDDPESSSGPPSQRTPKRVFLVDDAATLVYIANLGCIPLHVLGARAPDLARADFLTIDFDVKQSSLAHAVTLARTLHRILDAIGLVGHPKTSGQSGLHVLVPLGGQSFEVARTLAELLGRLLCAEHPDLATMDRVVGRRGARVYVDTGQTGTSRAIVAPYSVRAVPGATVSAPLSWDEVTPDLDPRAFDMTTMPVRVRARGDLLRGWLDSPPDVATAVSRLADLAAPRST